MSLHIHCDFCGELLSEPGSLLFDPPDEGGKSRKRHICVGCPCYPLMGFVMDRLEAFRDRTNMWGSMEAVELQALLLLEVEVRASDPKRMEADARLVLRTYDQLCDSPLHKTALAAEFGQRLFDTCQKVRAILYEP